MKFLTTLSLEGHGYLTHLDMTTTPATAKIVVKPTPLYEEGLKTHSDEIILECRVMPHLEGKLRHLKQNFPTSEEIPIHYRTLYNRFDACHTGQQDRDPPNMLILKCELVDMSA